MSDPSLQYVPVPVPARHVPAVYRLLAELVLAELDLAAEPVDGTEGWTDDRLREFMYGKTRTAPIIRDILDVLAETPGEWTTLDQLSAVTGSDRQQLKGVWTHVGRHLAKHFPGHRSPIEAMWGKDMEPRRDAVNYYRISEARAGQWERVRQG